MLDPNKHGTYNKEIIKKPNWSMISILVGTIWFWYSVFTNGFFVSVMWLVVLSAIIGLYFRLSGRA